MFDIEVSGALVGKRFGGGGGGGAREEGDGGTQNYLYGKASPRVLNRNPLI